MTTFQIILDLLHAMCCAEKRNYILIVLPRLGSDEDPIASSNMTPPHQLKMLQRLIAKMQPQQKKSPKQRSN